MNCVKLCVLSLGLFLSITVSAMPPVTKTVSVNGTASCKEQIESTALGVNGVSGAVWDSNTKQLTINYAEDQLAYTDVLVALAEAGYDNELIKARPNNYNNLPEACKYTRD